MFIQRGQEVIGQCDMCGTSSRMILSEEETESFYRYLGGGIPIQECFPELNRCEREFLKSGDCPACQDIIFGNGETERIF